MRLESKTAVFFDLDDTLYCEHEYVMSGFGAVANHLSRLNGAYSNTDLYNFMLQEWKHNGRGKIFDRLLGHFKVDAHVGELIRIYREHTPTLELYPDAKRLIGELLNRGIPLGLITDGNHMVQRSKIKALGLEQAIACIIVTDELGKECWKPSKVPYTLAKDYYKGQASRFIYIGDNPHKDFCTAKQLGFYTIRIIRDIGDYMTIKLEEEYEADWEIRSLDELLV